MSRVPLAGEDFDLKNYEGMDPVQMMFAMRRDLEFKMPPVGRSESRMIFGGQEYRRTTWRCDKPNCWYVIIAGDEDKVDRRIELHYSGTAGESNCPTPPRRESLKSGLAEIEKLWREIDDVMDALKAGEPYRKMEGKELQAYVKGIAFSIVMKDTPLWPTIKDVAAQALKRWKMRQGEIPFEATPTTHANNYSSIGTPGGWMPTNKPAPAKTAPIKRAAPRKAAPAAPALPADKIRDIKAARASTMFSDEDIAVMYGVTISQVKSVQ